MRREEVSCVVALLSVVSVFGKYSKWMRRDVDEYAPWRRGAVA